MNWYFASGDLDFFWGEQIQSLSWLPQVFHAEKGFGLNALLSLWLDYPFRLLLKLLSSVGLSWFIIEKLLWISVFALAMYSSKKLAEYVLGKNVFIWLAPVIYAANTYMLLLFAGGQLGVSWAYAFTPWVLLKFIQTIDVQKMFSWRQGIINGLFFALLIIFDLRFAYLTLLMIGLCAAFRRRLPLSSWVISFLTAGLAHAFWILPAIFVGGGTTGLGEEFTNPGMLKFLSVADFSHALSLLHPNWPENLFGKVYFMQPEFLVLPLLAFGALVWKGRPFFVLLALAGAFFAKGVNEPFGGIYAWMFAHVPGFVMFRDPTKFYLYIAIAYSLLIPYILQKINKKIVYIFFVLFWVFTLRGFSIRVADMPREYVQLKDMLVADTIPSRTLWIPQRENYAYFSDMHPLLATESAFVNDPLFIQKISRMGVKYVIVPQDVNKRLFLTDYRFDQSLRTALIEALGKTSLKQSASFRDIAVFENDRFIFERNTPAVVAKQQKLANIGLVISVISLVIFGGTVSKKQ